MEEGGHHKKYIMFNDANDLKGLCKAVIKTHKKHSISKVGVVKKHSVKKE
jgi:hypothetical protein